jgi:hypothetical protein
VEPGMAEVRESLLIQVLAGTPSPAPESSTVNFMDNRNDIREFLATRRPTIRSVQFALGAITDAPAFVRNGRRDILATNRLGYALNSEMYIGPVRPANHARFIFLEEERARRFFPEWELAANRPVAIDLSADTGLSLLINPAEPDSASASADALRLLASWAGTQSRGEQSRATAAASEGA